MAPVVLILPEETKKADLGLWVQLTVTAINRRSHEVPNSQQHHHANHQGKHNPPLPFLLLLYGFFVMCLYARKTMGPNKQLGLHQINNLETKSSLQENELWLRYSCSCATVSFAYIYSLKLLNLGLGAFSRNKTSQKRLQQIVSPDTKEVLLSVEAPTLHIHTMFCTCHQHKIHVGHA